MTRVDDDAPTPELSVVIPSFNSAPWLPSTLRALAEAVTRAGREVEVIIVDDGSTDNTAEMLAEIAEVGGAPLHLINQENRGRFLARWSGLEAARAEIVLLLDSRVLIGGDSLQYVFERIDSSPAIRVWNAHTYTADEAPLVGRFWDVPTHIFWGEYLRNPRPYDLNADNFDSAPKGTTMFLAPREVLRSAFRDAWPDSDSKLVSDDTKVLRQIATREGIRLDPGFHATYRPRTTTRGFVAHTLDRGTLFVDSYAGTSRVRSVVLVGAVVAPVVVIAGVLALALGGLGRFAAGAVFACVGLAVAPTIPAALNRCPPRSIVAYVLCFPLFILPFWAGLLRGLFIHRRAFGRARHRTPLGETP